MIVTCLDLSRHHHHTQAMRLENDVIDTAGIYDKYNPGRALRPGTEDPAGTRDKYAAQRVWTITWLLFEKSLSDMAKTQVALLPDEHAHTHSDVAVIKTAAIVDSDAIANAHAQSALMTLDLSACADEQWRQVWNLHAALVAHASPTSHPTSSCATATAEATQPPAAVEQEGVIKSIEDAEDEKSELGNGGDLSDTPHQQSMAVAKKLRDSVSYPHTYPCASRLLLAMVQGMTEGIVGPNFLLKSTKRAPSSSAGGTTSSPAAAPGAPQQDAEAKVGESESAHEMSVRRQRAYEFVLAAQLYCNDRTGPTNIARLQTPLAIAVKLCQASAYAGGAPVLPERGVRHVCAYLCISTGTHKNAMICCNDMLQ